MDYHDLNEAIEAIILNHETTVMQTVSEKQNYWKSL